MTKRMLARPCAHGTLCAGPPGILGPRRYFAGTRRGPPSGGLLCCGLPFTASPRERDDLHDILDGPVTDFTLSLAWTPVLRVQWNVGYEHRHAQSEHWRNLSRWLRVGTSLALPLGFTFGTSA